MTEATRNGATEGRDADVAGGVLVSGRRVADVGMFADLAVPVAFCLACGVAQEPSPNCSSCGRSRVVAPVEQLTTGAVRVGYLGRGPGAPPGVAVDHAPGLAHSIAFSVGGELHKQSPREFARLSNVEGLRALQSRAAAVLLVLLQPPDRRFKGSPQALEAAAATMLGSSSVAEGAAPELAPLAVARRAAAGLAVVGATEPLSLLGFTAHELTWWTALGQINGGELRGAVNTLAATAGGSLPDGDRPPAVVLAARRRRPVGPRARARDRTVGGEQGDATGRRGDRCRWARGAHVRLAVVARRARGDARRRDAVRVVCARRAASARRTRRFRARWCCRRRPATR